MFLTRLKIKQIPYRQSAAEVCIQNHFPSFTFGQTSISLTRALFWMLGLLPVESSAAGTFWWENQTLLLNPRFLAGVRESCHVTTFTVPLHGRGHCTRSAAHSTHFATLQSFICFRSRKQNHVVVSHTWLLNQNQSANCNGQSCIIIIIILSLSNIHCRTKFSPNDLQFTTFCATWFYFMPANFPISSLHLTFFRPRICLP